MDDIKFQIKLPGYEEQKEDDGKESEVSKKPKEDKGSKRSKKGKARPRRTAAERCDRCCYCCVLCCESVFFTVGSAIRILMSVAVVGLMFWTALYVYTTISNDEKRVPPGGSNPGAGNGSNPGGVNLGNGTLLRGLNGEFDGSSEPVGSSYSLVDLGGLEANDGPDTSSDLRKLNSGSGGSGEPVGSRDRLAESDNGSDSTRDPGGGSDDDSHGDTCSDIPNHPGCVRSGGPGDSSDDACDSRGVSSNPADPDNVVDTSNGPGVLVNRPGDLDDGDNSGDSGGPGGDSVPDDSR